MRERALDIVFLVGVVAKGIDGLVEVVGGGILLALSPGQLANLAQGITAKELSKDPHDTLANLVVHGVEGLDTGTMEFVGAYLLLHGVVKIAIVVALLLGSRRVYPWTIAALAGFLVFQLYELIVHPSVLVAALTVLDALIIWLTWREWRRGHTLREAFRRDHHRTTEATHGA